MGQVLHGSARTTAAVRRTIQHKCLGLNNLNYFRFGFLVLDKLPKRYLVEVIQPPPLSQESLSKLAERFDLNPKTVAKWRKRKSALDAPMGPKQARSTILTPEEETTAVAFRKHTLWPLDDCLYALQASIPHLTRSSLHRCLVRHGINRLPALEEKSRTKKTFKPYPLGYFHVDIAEVRTEEGKLYLFVAIDRTSKFAYAELHPRATKMIAAWFLRTLIEAVPYKLHTVLTDNGVQFTNRQQDLLAGVHSFDRVCLEHNIEHRLTKPNHPWTNGQVERMNRTLKDATFKRYHYETHRQLEGHLHTFLMAYNFAPGLDTDPPYVTLCEACGWNSYAES